jgi:acetyl esterase
MGLEVSMKTTHDVSTLHLEPVTAEFVKQLSAQGGPPIYKLPVPAARELLKKLQSGPVDKAPAKIDDLSIEGGPQGKVALRIIRPLDDNSKLPVVVFLYGGGWILGSEYTHDRLVRQIAYDAHVAVVVVKYTPSPEAHYPVALEQAYAALEYIAHHASELNFDASRLAVAGDSVGGNMATVLTLLAKERKGPKIAYQVLFYPVTDAGMDTQSYELFAEGPWLTKAAMEWFWKAYEPDEAARMKLTMSPLRASLEQLKGLPPALIITAENDVLRDEGEAYAHKLMQAGVQVRALRCLGTMHDFVMLNALAQSPPAQIAMSVVHSTLHTVFAQ